MPSVQWQSLHEDYNCLCCQRCSSRLCALLPCTCIKPSLREPPALLLENCWVVSLLPMPTSASRPRPGNPLRLHLSFVLTLTAHFGAEIAVGFCLSAAQPPADSCGSPLQPSRPQSRACAKLLVRSGLRCALCFRLKSDCLCLHTNLLSFQHALTSGFVTSFLPRPHTQASDGTGIPLPSWSAYPALSCI